MKQWKQPDMKELDIMNTNHKGGSAYNGYCVPNYSSPVKDKDKDKDKPGKGWGRGRGKGRGRW